MRAILEHRTLTTPAGLTLTAIAAGPSSTRPYSEDNRTVLSLELEDEFGGPASVILGAEETAAPRTCPESSRCQQRVRQ